MGDRAEPTERFFFFLLRTCSYLSEFTSASSLVNLGFHSSVCFSSLISPCHLAIHLTLQLAAPFLPVLFLPLGLTQSSSVMSSYVSAVLLVGAPGKSGLQQEIVLGSDLVLQVCILIFIAFLTRFLFTSFSWQPVLKISGAICISPHRSNQRLLPCLFQRNYYFFPLDSHLSSIMAARKLPVCTFWDYFSPISHFVFDYPRFMLHCYCKHEFYHNT